MVSFTDLPEEMKLYIFSYFNQHLLFLVLAKVSLEWQHLSCSYMFWKTVSIDHNSCLNYQDILSSVSSIGYLEIDLQDGPIILPEEMVCQEHLKTLKLIGDLSAISENDSYIIANNFPALEKLDLVLTIPYDYYNATLMQFFKLPNVTQLSMKSMIYKNFDFKDYETLICEIIVRFKKLTYLQIDVITPRILTCLIDYHCLSLTHLIIKNNIYCILDKTESAKLIKFKKLQNLHIVDFWLDKSLLLNSCFWENYSYLTTIVLGNGFIITDSELKTISRVCTQLHTLLLSENENISNRGITEIILFCKSLTHLKIKTFSAKINSEKATFNLEASNKYSQIIFRPLLHKVESTILSLEINWLENKIPTFYEFLIDNTFYFEKLKYFTLNTNVFLSQHECEMCVLSFPFIDTITVTNRILYNLPTHWFNPLIFLPSLKCITIYANVLDHFQLNKIKEICILLERLYICVGENWFSYIEFLNLCNSRQETLKSIGLHNTRPIWSNKIINLDPKITSICLSNYSLSQVITLEKMINLQTLTLSQIMFYTSEIMLLPASLKYLNLDTVNVDDLFLEKVSLACPLLRSLEIHNCRKITENGLRKIIDGCQNLQEMRIYNMYISSIFTYFVPLTIDFVYRENYRDYTKWMNN